mgnify:CR=1 FL=1
MVRLRGPIAVVPLYLRRFQFQYGAIKSHFSDRNTFLVTEFQFQYGAIKSPWGIVARPETNISIPVWCD